MFPQKKLYKNTFYTGLKATHFIEEMSKGMFFMFIRSCFFA